MRGRDIDAAFGVEGEPLRTTEAAVEGFDGAVRVDTVDGVETGDGRARHVEVTAGTEGKMVRGDAGLERSVDKYLAVARNLEDGAAAVADIEVFVVVEGEAGGDAHALRVGAHGAVGRNPIDGAVGARGDVEVAGAIEGHTGGVHHLGDERRHLVIGVDLENGDRYLLSARAGEGGVDVAFAIDGGIRDGMKTIGDGDGDPDVVAIAGGAVG